MNDRRTRSALRVCETFVSIQGESTRAGAPCFFIRLAGCNLRCSYCDTKYAREGGTSRSVESLVREFRGSGLPLVEVTGGEPLLQDTTITLLSRLLRHGTVMIETNGSIDISRIPARVIAIMDVKCPGSGESDAMNPRNLDLLRPNDEVKFVISDRGDFEWARDLIAAHELSRKCNAVLMSPADGALASGDLAEWMLQERVPARLNIQIHKTIWRGAKRGR